MSTGIPPGRRDPCWPDSGELSRARSRPGKGARWRGKGLESFVYYWTHGALPHTSGGSRDRGYPVIQPRDPATSGPLPATLTRGDPCPAPVPGPAVEGPGTPWDHSGGAGAPGPLTIKDRPRGEDTWAGRPRCPLSHTGGAGAPESFITYRTVAIHLEGGRAAARPHTYPDAARPY